MGLYRERMFLRDEVQEPVGGLLLAGESDGGENGGPEPWVPSLGEGSARNTMNTGRPLGTSCTRMGSSPKYF